MFRACTESKTLLQSALGITVICGKEYLSKFKTPSGNLFDVCRVQNTV